VNDAAAQARARQVELVLERLGSLPTLSPVATKLMNAGSHDDVDVAELARLIEADPSLTGKVLSMCRRADKGLGDKITSVGRAVTLLGLDAVTSAVLSVEVFDALGRDGTEPSRSGFDAKGHWRHAIAVASAAELFAAAGRGALAKPETAFIAGLLHSIGRMALEIALPGAYGKVLRVAEQRGVDSAPLERDLIGLDHHAAGRKLAETWGLPRALRDCVWLNAHPAASLPKTPHRGLIALVAAGRALCRRLNLGWSGDFGPTPDVVATCIAAGIDPADIERVTRDLPDRVAERSATLGLDDVTGPELMLESVLRANVRLAQLNISLEKRSAHGDQQRRTLRAVAEFVESLEPKGLTDTMARVAAAAIELAGGESATLVVQCGDEPLWHAARFDAEARPIASAVEPPPTIDQGHPAELAIVAASPPVGFRGRVLIPWLARHLGQQAEADSIRSLPLPVAGGAAVLLMHADLTEIVQSELQRRALLGAWGAALAAALRQEESERLAVELAERHLDLADAQSRLTENRAMARLGEMTAGAAHQMNNPLAVIKGYGQVLRRRAKESALREPAEKIAQAAQEMSDLITSLHLLAEPPKAELARTSITDVINAAVQTARERTGRPCGARIVIAEQAPLVRTDAALLGRALAELIANAAEAESDEILEIRVQTDPLDDRLMIVVKDKGRGMSPHEREHAFDPFFSSRPAGRGVGLGLCRARRLVEPLGGTITLASEVGEGTRATVTLPGWRAEAEDPPAVGRAA
jgi:signal transduction histidine kinase/HD-like signal output (HDOD) protein